jgi:hypothetical protein
MRLTISSRFDRANARVPGDMPHKAESKENISGMFAGTALRTRIE